MEAQTWSAGLSCALAEVRAELTRLGLSKEDFDRCGVTVDELDREVLRRFMQRRGSVAAIVGEVLVRIGLVASPAEVDLPEGGCGSRRSAAECVSS